MVIESLSSNQLEYLFFHLQQHVAIDDNWTIIHQPLNEPLPANIHSAVVFPSSSGTISWNRKVHFMDREVPILFTASSQKEIFTIDERGNLLFHHDILKSAFYVLSGYQEKGTHQLDSFDRFSYKNSIQQRLDMVTYPVVNYYFEMIIAGLEAYCQHHSFSLQRKRLFHNCGFFLSHDVDRVAFYTWREAAFKVKQMLGLAPLTYSYRLTFYTFLQTLSILIFPMKKSDPWWNFEWLMQLEKELGIRSTFFFLKNLHKKRDSRYQFADKKILGLINDLISNGFEVGLHGSFDSYNHPSMLKQQLDELAAVVNSTPLGIRQHFLRFKHPETFKHQINAGLTYDCSLGFAEHDGYRNGYCYPFKPYDFDNDRMLNIWEIPLVMMEVSVLDYRGATFDDLHSSVLHHLNEAKKFGGIFSLLWHNCRLMDEEYDGVSAFYPQLLKDIVNFGAHPLTGEAIIERVC